MLSDAVIAAAAEVLKMTTMVFHPTMAKSIAQSGIADSAVMVLATAFDEALAENKAPVIAPVPTPLPDASAKSVQLGEVIASQRAAVAAQGLAPPVAAPAAVAAVTNSPPPPLV